MSGAPRLDLLRCDLDGRTLVEASAGTGKTYAIAALFVRLLVEARLPVGEVLVVTFTEAATEELRGRIRTRVREALAAFSGGGAADPFLAGLVGKTGDRDEAHRRLALALRSFDEAAIHTIHGFCRRVLQEAAFESGSSFDAELVEDERPALQEVVDDFWRREMLGAPAALVRQAAAHGLTPESLAKLVGRRAAQPFLTVLPAADEGGPAGAGPACRAAFEALAAAWRDGGREAVRLLAEDPGIHRGRCRTASVPGWARELAAFLEAGVPDAPVEALERFCASAVAEVTKSGREPPAHPVFDACEALRAARTALREDLARQITALKIRCLEHVRRELPRWKADRNVRSFDDLLLDVREALAGPAGAGLVRALRERYRAALIDEFQDTDPVQYEILRRVFAPDPARLFLIGDPKQAIYSFRGADVFAYMHAARHAERRYTLEHNWRSAPELIAAVNAVFGRGPGAFVFRDIPFQPVAPAPRADRERLEVGGEPDGAPLRVWFVPPPEGKGVVNKGDGASQAAEAVASEVVRLLAAAGRGELTVGGVPLAPEHVAVLVRTNLQARMVQRSLVGRGVPSVLYSAESVFASREAAEMGRVLGAVADPGDAAAVRTALATDVLGRSGNELAAVVEDDAAWDRWVQRLFSYREQWQRAGFAPMARTLLAAEGVRPRLLAREDGERRLTNVLHVVELLQRAAAEQRLGPEGVLQWLSARLVDPSEPEEHQMRLETDERAAKVVTVHKSKGLEYAVTFVPFQWNGLRDPEGDPCFHAPDDPLHVILDLGSERRGEHAALARREEFAENVRLLYVALTRARHRCTVVWGPFRDAGTSALAHVLHPAPADAVPDDPVAACAARLEALGEEGMRADLDALAAEAGGRLRVEPIPGASPARHEPRAGPERPLACRRPDRAVSTEWAVASFSSLVSGRGDAAEHPDRDEAAEEAQAGEAEAAARAAGTIFAFPRGTRAGSCLHEIFEEAAYAPPDPGALRELAAVKLARYGFDPAWRETVARMAERVLSAPLGPGGPRLCEVGRADRVNEMEFFVPLARVTHEGLARVFALHGGPAIPAGFPERLERLEFSPARGVLRGFVDLVFRHGGRYYLLDWKSNFLGWTADDYGPEALARAMEDHLYTLQACLYAAALHGHLAARLPGYRYEEHFGGAAYVFLRGVDPERGGGRGVYWSRPSLALVEGLHRYLTTGAP